MEIRVLGGYGAEFFSIDKGVPTRYHRSGFLINRSVVLEAGTVCSVLTFSESMAIGSIFLSHAHLDHVQGIASLADTLCGKVSQPITVFGIEDTIKTLKQHLFNNKLWPDFTKLPTEEAPTLRYQVIEAGKPITVSGLNMTPISTHHSVPSTGFIIDDGRAAVVFSGDTHQTEALWQSASQIPYLKAAFIECSFPNRLSQLAYKSGHLTPSLTNQEFLKIKRDVPFYTYHMKPAYLEEIRMELAGFPNAHLLNDGMTLHF